MAGFRRGSAFPLAQSWPCSPVLCLPQASAGPLQCPEVLCSHCCAAIASAVLVVWLKCGAYHEQAC